MNTHIIWEYLNLESEVRRLNNSATTRSYEGLKSTIIAVSAQSIGRIVIATCEVI